MNIDRRRAFTVVELIVLVCIVALIIGILVPASTGGRRSAPNVVAQANLRSLNTGAGNYAGDHGDQLFMLGSSERAADILRRATGRAAGRGLGRVSDFDGLDSSHELLLRMRYSHLVLLDYLMDRQPEPISASPFDENLIDWQENLLGYLDAESDFPYAKGMPKEAGYDMDPMWVEEGVKQLWGFGSSYQVVYHAWVDDDEPQYVPMAGSPHHMVDMGTGKPLGGRKMTEVKFPSLKVFMYEEFDRDSDPKGIYAAYPEAKVNLAFFDGSIRGERTMSANSAFDAGNPDGVWEQRYVPLDTFPVPMGGLGEEELLDLRFRWTKGGLGGFDFGGG